MEGHDGLQEQQQQQQQPVPNGGVAEADDFSSNQIVAALNIIHDPHSSNDRRKQAGEFLEQAKAQKQSPLHGFNLAQDQSQPPIVRHFALGLIEHAIRYYWTEYDLNECRTLRGWVVVLAQTTSGNDPIFIRNKIAQLWVEVAKRSWTTDWHEMDRLLVELLDKNVYQTELCLCILESLVEDVFNRDDAPVVSTKNVLHKCCVDIFTPKHVLAAAASGREKDLEVRFGDEGWVNRLITILDRCLSSGFQEAEAESIACQAISTMRTAMSWLYPRAIIESKVVDHLGRALTCGRTPVQLIATECLNAIFSRSLTDGDDFRQIVCPMYFSTTVAQLRNILHSIRIDPESIDNEEYLFLKRYSEMAHSLAISLEERISEIPPDCNLSDFITFLYEFSVHESLSVSLPIVSAWARILRRDTLGDSPAVLPYIPRLLQLATDRLVRYESLPEGTVLASLLFLDEDIEAIPERHAFLGNYRRFLSSIVDSMVRRRPLEAMPYILREVDTSINNIITQGPLNFEAYRKHSHTFLKLEAQLTVVEAALKGYMKWTGTLTEGEQPEGKAEVEALATTWCEALIKYTYEDPLFKKKVIQIVVAFSTTALEQRIDLMLKVLEHILLTRPNEHPTNSAYNDAVKDLQSVCTNELQRLAMKMPDHLIEVYSQLEMKINEIIANDNPDERHQIAYHTFLFTISHRTRNIDPALRQSRLEGYIKPILESWTSPQLTEALSTFDGFCHLLGLDDIQQYLAARRVYEIADFSKQLLDAEGQAKQAELNERYKVLPLRPTKAFLGVSTDKLKRGSNEYNTACALWHDVIPAILPNLLKFLSHAHAFHNPKYWDRIPQELHGVMKKVLTDRFWQAGISTGSRDEFYENVSKTKITLEGLASSIRGTIRMVRESCYSILWAMSRLDVHFYGFEELPGPLSHALFADAHALSSHQMTILLNMCRYIIDECPVNLRQHFLTPFMATMLRQVDHKVSNEWQELNALGLTTAGEDKLTEEMKEESILRQLTYTAVLIVAQLLDPARTDGSAGPDEVQLAADGTVTRTEGGMRDFLLSSNAILEPLILFCTHVIGMRDTRCCGIIIRVFRSIVPEFTESNRTEIREFICREVFKACINSIHEDYFVDLQKDLAQLIVQIYLLYSPSSITPMHLLTQLPGMTEQRVENFSKRLMVASSVRLQRTLMLDLLEGLRGVAISEKGKVTMPSISKQKDASERERERERHLREEREKEAAARRSPDLGGVADMFG